MSHLTPLWKVRMHSTDGEAKDVFIHAASMFSAARMAGSSGSEYVPVRVTRVIS